jgi:hypothetical protein
MTMRTGIIPGLLFAFSLAPSGCTSNLQSLEGRIFFSVREDFVNDYSVGPPRILLEMKTEKIYGCCNNRLISEIVRSGSFIAVNLKGVLFPEICLTALGPATSRDFLNLPEGVYSLNFQQWSVPDRYTLTVKKDAIEITPMLSTFTAPEYTEFWRYPENSFAYYCGTLTQTAWICDDFAAHLLGEIDLEEFHFPDTGEICYPPSGGGHYYDSPPRYFKYKKEGDFDLAGELLMTYAERLIIPDQGTALGIRNWKNKSYCSY